MARKPLKISQISQAWSKLDLSTGQWSKAYCKISFKIISVKQHESIGVAFTKHRPQSYWEFVEWTVETSPLEKTDKSDRVVPNLRGRVLKNFQGLLWEAQSCLKQLAEVIKVNGISTKSQALKTKVYVNLWPGKKAVFCNEISINLKLWGIFAFSFCFRISRAYWMLVYSFFKCVIWIYTKLRFCVGACTVCKLLADCKRLIVGSDKPLCFPVRIVPFVPFAWMPVFNPPCAWPDFVIVLGTRLPDLLPVYCEE